MHAAQALEILARHMSVGLVVWQYDDEARALKLLCANAAADRLSGVELTANVGRTMRELFPGVGEPMHARFVELACAESKAEPSLTRLPDALTDRSAFSMRVMSMPDRCVGVVFQELGDDSGLLAAREKRFRALLEYSTDAIVVTDDKATMLYASPPFERILGYENGEIIGAVGYPLVHPDDQALTRAEFEKVLSRPNEPVKNQIRLRHRDGSWRLVEVVTVNRLNDSNVQAIVSNFRDITELRQTEEALRNTEEQLQHARKMEAVGRLAGGVAHDFNNLLTIVLSYSEMLLSDPLPASAHESLSEIKRAGERAEVLTRQLLAFSRRQVLEPRTIDLNRTISDVLRLVHRMVGETINVHFRPGPDLWVTRLDPDQLVQALLNLVANARDAMPGGGSLTIETANFVADTLHGESHLGVAPGPYVMLAITDSGIGMDHATRVRIFEPFFTTKEVGKGTGLGLSMVHGIVEQSGGSIWVYSERGLGTTFKLYFPRARHDQVDAPEPIAARVPETLTGTETILVVDDDVSVREVARRILAAQGYRVITAGSGEEALRQAAGSEDLHLLVTDVVMPDTNGPVLARRLREQRPGLKVLFISGYSDTALHSGLVERAASYMQKPLTQSTFARRIRQVLDLGGQP
jgi:two-component system cell cycle sensor histidine kinase/response regulator CckA